MSLKIALLSPVAWKTPPDKYGPWELVVANLAKGLVGLGHDVTVFATKDSSINSFCKLEAICPTPWEESDDVDPKVMEYQHISHCFEMADKFDVIHNHFDFMPLAYSRLVDIPIVTTIHGFSSEKILPIYQKYTNDKNCHYVAISEANRHPTLTYTATIYHGVDSRNKYSNPSGHAKDLLFLGRLHPDKGPEDAIKIAKLSNHRLYIGGLIQDRTYFDEVILPNIDNEQIIYLGCIGEKEKASLYPKIKALLHPIYFEEPFGLSVAESLMQGVPVIAYNRGSMRELIINEMNGYLVSGIDEAIQKLQLISNLSHNDIRQDALERFSLDKMCQAYSELYYSIMKQ